MLLRYACKVISPSANSDRWPSPDVKPVAGRAKTLKRILLKGIRAGGGFALAKSSRWRTNRLVILCYHGISLADEHEWQPGLFISPMRFARRMQILKEAGYAIVSLEDGLRRLDAGNLDSASVAITFDDGLFSFYQKALPVLESLGYPVTLYLTTFYSDLQEPIFGLLCNYMFWRCRNAVLDLEPITGDRVSYQLSDARQRQMAADRIQRYALETGLSGAEKADLGERIAARLSFDIQALRQSRILNLMTTEEIADASRRGTSIELHTHRHRTPMDRNEFLREIDDNQQRIVTMTGRTPNHFSYPGGVYSEIFFQWLKERGVISATTCDAGIASRSTMLLRVPRILDVTGLGDIEFEGWLCGVSALLPRRRVQPPAPLPDLQSRAARRSTSDHTQRAY